MKHRIVVLGAGYAGTYVAGNLARRLSPADTEITVVNAEPDFVQRQRLNQLAAGREVEAPSLVGIFAGTGIRLRVARVTGIEPGRRIVGVVDAGSGGGGVGGAGDAGDEAGSASPAGGEVRYDTLVYALGSRVADQGVPGVAEYAFNVADRPSALRLRERLAGLGRRGEGGGRNGGEVLVVGDGLTGIETATEIAECRPGLSVTLVARGELGARLSAGARGHLRRACGRLGVGVVEHAEVTAVEATGVRCADGTVLPSDATVWTAGFAVGPLAAASGLEVTGDGRIVVDRTMRSVSHPDVYAIGDSVHTLGDNGLPLPMNCGTAGCTGRQAIESIVARLTGRTSAHARLVHLYSAISLGRRDGILHLIDTEGRARPRHLSGRKAVRIKAAIQRGALWGTAHPTFGMPRRGRRVVAEAAGTGADASARTSAA